MPRLARTTLAAAALIASTPAFPAFVSFDLTRSDQLRDGSHFLRVTLDDEGAPGSINFHVDVLGPLPDLSGRRFGIDEFAFNSASGIGSRNIAGLPKDWRAGGSDTVGPFGRYDESVVAKKPEARMASLSFSIVGIKWDTIAGYLEPSSGRAKEGNFFFAAHVDGLDGDFNCVTDANFAGSTPTLPLPTPLPGAAWLLAGGLGIFGRALLRRRAPVPAMRNAVAAPA